MWSLWSLANLLCHSPPRPFTNSLTHWHHHSHTFQVLWLHADYFTTPSSTKSTRPKSKLFGHCIQLHGGPHHTPATRQGHAKKIAVSISGRLYFYATEAEPGSNSLFQHGHQRVWVCAPCVLFSEDGPHTLQRQCVHVQKGVQKAGGALYLALSG